MTHVTLVSLGLAVLAVCWWWMTQRLSPLVERPGIPASKAAAAEGPARARETTANPARPVPATPGRQVQKSSERLAQADRLVLLERNLAQQQEAALAGVAEHEYPAALAAFAEARHDEIAAAAEARDALSKHSGAPAESAPLAGAEALRVRFDAVRRSIIEDGLSIEDAESRFHASHSDP